MRELLQIWFMLKRCFYTTAFLSPVLWLGWNYGVIKFLPTLPVVDWRSAVIALGMTQILSSFCVRRIHQEVIPVFIPPGVPADEQANNNNQP